MAARESIEAEVENYLRMVAAHLEAVSPEERQETLGSVEAHIYDAVKERAGGQPTVQDVRAVLAEMDPPESYAQAAEARQEHLDAPPPARLCKLPLIAALVPPVYLALVAPFAPRLWPNAPIETALLLTGAVSIGSLLLCLVAIFRIRASEGRLVGMPLAITVGLFYPLVTVLGFLLLA